MSKRNKLTDQQRLFCKEYIIDFNASAAAIRAGYKHPDYGRQLLTKTHVQDYIQKLMEKREKTATKKGEDVIEELIKIGFSDITKYLEIKTEMVLEEFQIGEQISKLPINKQYVKLTDSDDWVDTGSISEISQAKDGSLKIKLHDKRAALTDLGKHFGIIKERHEHTGKDGKPIQTESTTKVIIGLPGKVPTDPMPEEKK